MNTKEHEITPIPELFSYSGKDYVLNKIHDTTFNSTFYVGVEFGVPCKNVWEQQFLILNDKKQPQKDNKGKVLFTTLYKAINIADNGFDANVIKATLTKPKPSVMERKFLLDVSTIESGAVNESLPPTFDVLAEYLTTALDAYDVYDILA